MHARALVVAGLVAAACSPITPPGLVLDVGRECQDIRLELADPDVLPGSTIHAAAIARSGDDASWYLASASAGALELRRVPEDMPGLDLAQVAAPHELYLQRGPVEGQLWLALDRDGGARLWRIDEASAAIDEGPLLVDFPDPGAEPASRRVVFLGHSPHLVAIPRRSTVGELAVEVAAITPSLALGERWSLKATVVCAPLSELSCPLFWDDLRDVTVLDVAEAGSLAGAALLLAISSPDAAPVDPQAPPAFETHILSVAIQRDATAERPVLTRRDHVAWVTQGPVLPSPAQIAADPLGLYVLVGLVPGLSSSGADATTADYLFRASLLGDGSSQAGAVIALLPKEFRSHLLQLGSRVAIGQRPGAAWHVAPIEGVTIDETIVGSLELGDSAQLLLAGRGQVIVTGQGRPTWQVQVACDAADPEDPDPVPEGI